MTINKALEHFDWKFRNVWKPTKLDVEAINTIIKFKENQESINLSENEALAKLWIHQLMLLNETEMYTAQRAIQVIDEILSHSVYDWALKLHEQTNIMRFRTVLNTDEYRKALIKKKPIKMQEIGSKIIEGKEDELKDLFTDEVKEENIIKFIENHITRIMK